MTTRTITLQLPADLYDRLEALAGRSPREIAQAAVAILADALTRDGESGLSLEQDLAQLMGLPDDELWSIVSDRVVPAVTDELAALNDKAQREGLSTHERVRQHELARQVERSMVIRGTAASLLRSRGHDTSRLFTSA